VREARAIVEELRKYDEELNNKPRWLVLNKLDMLPADERDERVRAFLEAYGWSDLKPDDSDGFDIKTPRVFAISAISGDGTRELTLAIMSYLEVIRAAERAERDARPVLFPTEKTTGSSLIQPETDAVAPATDPVADIDE